MSKVTIYDVAKEAGCSTATVSLVLQNSDKIKASTQQRVLDAVEKLGYLPNFAARSLSSKFTNLLGLIVPNMENPLFAHMIKGVEEYANSKGYGIILGISDLSLDKEMFYMQMLQERRVDGLLVFPTFVDEIFERFICGKSDESIPLVLCGSTGVQEYPVSYVKCDNRMGAYMATDHLVTSGRRRIGCLCAVADHRQAESRINGYRDALMFHGIERDDDLIPVLHPGHGGYPPGRRCSPAGAAGGRDFLPVRLYEHRRHARCDERGAADPGGCGRHGLR